ncbi:CU044_5270 family protein [Planosporangium mesophilum]|uniref:CU044_5270 family protein n=1 Tax=Planosporangium mesophilum TaxID=689768 RepID=A0A8J3X257_9ACTN|nr:CU044_5270 family protein [Planosporangium mesophilum]NJC83215.1 hypothetical protein [Planosporangium mesophilum]GII21588.1 hypothetical protein Pme01_11850 [Planosporangium mesophilum]
MDEITLVKRLGADVPEPDAAALRRIRHEVLAGLPERPAARRRRWSIALLRGRHPAIRFAVAAGLAGAIALATVAVDTLVTRDGRPVIGHEAAATELNRAAEAAISASDPPLAPGQFYYLRRVEVASTGIASRAPCDRLFYLHKNVSETWVPKDWDAQWMTRQTADAERRFLRPGDEAKAEACPDALAEPKTEVRKAPAGLFYPRGVSRPGDEPRDSSGTVVYDWSPEQIAERLAGGFWQEPTPPFMAGLPRDPRKLLERIYRDSAGAGRGRDDEAFVFVRDILRSGVVPADLRAALFSAAALIPGVRLVGDSVNLEGRHGVAVAMSDHGQERVELIFDPASGEVIGERRVILRNDYIPGVKAGTTVGYTAVSRQIVAAMGAMPGR